MSDDEIRYRAWCEREDCDWSRVTTGTDSVTVQNISAAAMMGHGLATDHHETRHWEVENAE